MKITEFSVTGFRSLKEVVWRPGKLNVVIGPNNSGKTNLVRAIALIRDAAMGKLADSVLHLGGISSLLWDGRARSINWRVKVDTEGLSEPLGKFGKKVTYELDVERLGPFNTFRISRELLADYSRVEAGEASEPFKYLERDLKHAVFFDSQERRLAAHSDRIGDDTTLLSEISNVMASPSVWFFHQSLASWGIYHDLLISDTAKVRQAAVTRKTTRLDPDGQNLVPVLHTLYTTDREFKKELNDSMRAAFGRDFDSLEFPPAEDQRVQLRVSWASLRTAQSIADLSDGTLRFLMLVAILANPDRGDVVVIEEPETYLHPGMFPVIADLAAQASAASQVIFTTHSPQFLTSLGPRNPTTTVLNFAESATHMKVRDGLELERWLSKYSLGELFESGELEALP
jgi:predicted ATPase